MEIHGVHDLVFQNLLAGLLIGIHLSQCHIDRVDARVQRVIQCNALKPAAGRDQTRQENLVWSLPAAA